MENKKSFFLTLSGGLFLLALGIVVFSVLRQAKVVDVPEKQSTIPVNIRFGSFEKFKTDDEYFAYLERNKQSNTYSSFGSMRGEILMKENMALDTASSMPVAGGAAETGRVSSTNVQVLGIDEPDILKTNGTELFYSAPLRYGYENLQIKTGSSVDGNPISVSKRITVPPARIQTKEGGIQAIKAFPPAQLQSLSALNISGDMLLSDSILVVFDESNYGKYSVKGYDVSNPSKPSLKWTVSFAKNSSRVEARLFHGKLYLVMKTVSSETRPCLLKPFDLPNNQGTVKCTQIYHPETNISSDSVYTAYQMDPKNGSIGKQVSFIGSSDEATLYVSRNALYVAYFFKGDLIQVMSNFVSQNTDLFSKELAEKVDRLQAYDIGTQAKMVEFESLLSRFLAAIKEDDKLVFENNVNNRMKQFMKSHARELEKTGIVKIGLDSFRIDATGEVPGKTLNQFSLDEHSDNLRIATTVGTNSWFSRFGNLTQSFSDVYVLNSRLHKTGEVLDLGKTERIYSVRFIADKGYVVTFRQTDPFYVLDLKNPSKPELKGELKIPGYSSYLHPLTDTMLVGIGKEDNFVKASLFDVADPTNPQEIDKFATTEYWSEALNNHHAFLVDEKHQVFFMPGTDGGYVFSYKGNKLKMIKAISSIQAKRALFINNYLYIVGDKRIVVLDENSWNQVGELQIASNEENEPIIVY